MGKPRHTWTVEQKLTMIRAVLRDEPRVAALARQHGVSEQQIYRGNAQFLDGGRHALGRGKTPRTDQGLQSEHEPFKKLLGEKTLALEILKQLSRL